MSDATYGESRRIGRYRLREVIGVGAFATVHLATDERLDATVVLKVLAENHSLNPEVRERFIAEGRSLRRVRSPHVVTVHDIGESDRQQPYLVLEHADRGTLSERVLALRRSGWTATSADVLALARALTQALDAVHAAHIVHRDLSPSNVLLASVTTEGGSRDVIEDDQAPRHTGTLIAPDERLLLADLGMCKDLAVNSGLTVAGGTAGFRPPEMASGPALVDTRADLWSLSAVVAWLCEGSELQTIAAPVLNRSLAVAPEDRHPDAGSWLADLETVLSPPAPAPPRDAAQPADTGDGSAPSRWDVVSKPAVGVLLGAVLVTGLGGGWLLRGDGVPPDTTETARIAVTGPETATTGIPMTFTVQHTGVDSWVWVLPNGQLVVDEPSVTLTPSGPGTASITVRAQDDGGAPLQTTHDVTVTGP